MYLIDVAHTQNDEISLYENAPLQTQFDVNPSIHCLEINLYITSCHDSCYILFEIIIYHLYYPVNESLQFHTAILIIYQFWSKDNLNLR